MYLLNRALHFSALFIRSLESIYVPKYSENFLFDSIISFLPKTAFPQSFVESSLSPLTKIL